MGADSLLLFSVLFSFKIPESRRFPKIEFVTHFSGLCKWNSQHWSPLHHPKTGSSRHLSASVVPVCAVCDCCWGGSCCRSVPECMQFLHSVRFFFFIHAGVLQNTVTALFEASADTISKLRFPLTGSVVDSRGCVLQICVKTSLQIILFF